MELSYTDHGQGKVLVLIHGFCESKAIWGHSLKALSPHFRVLCIDLPGFGKSPLFEGSISIEEMADSINSLLEKLTIPNCTMIGHSLGGYVILSFAEKYSSRLSGFGLFHSTAFADKNEKKENRNKTITFIEKYGIDLFAKSFVPPLFDTNNRVHLVNEITLLTTIASTTNKHTIIEVTKAMRDRPDRSNVLTSFAKPILFIIGKKDPAIPLEDSLHQCVLPMDSTVHLYEDTGHMGMYERTLETVEAIKNFTSYCHQKPYSPK